MKTVISVRTDQDVKQKAQRVASRFGIPLSTLINAYLHELAETGQVYFSSVEVMTPEVEKQVVIAEKEIASGDVSPVFDTADGAIKYLKTL